MDSSSPKMDSSGPKMDSSISKKDSFVSKIESSSPKMDSSGPKIVLLPFLSSLKVVFQMCLGCEKTDMNCEWKIFSGSQGGQKLASRSQF